MTRFSKRFGKTAFVLTTAAILISVLLIFAAFVPSFSVVAEGADGEGSEPAAVVLEISDNEFSGGYADKKASNVTIGLDVTEDSGTVTQASGNRVTAQAFPYKTDESGSPLSYYTANINLGGKLQEAIAGGRLSAHIYFLGTITLNASSAGSVRENEPEVNVDLGFELSGGIDGEDAAEGILDASPDFVWDETQSLYTYSEVFEYTADNPLNITDGYVRLSGDSVVLQLYPSFFITRDVVSVGTISNEASAVISGNFYFAFDFYEVEVTLSTDNVQYGKLVAGDHGDLFTRYAEAVMSTSSVGSDEINSLGAELADLPSLTGDANSAVIPYGLTDDIVFTAIPLRGFYFNRWQQGITDTSKVINRGAASKIALNVGIVYSADFNSFSPTNIPVTGQGSGWVYDGSQHGPSLNDGALPGFKVDERYVGSTNKDETYNMTQQPTEAGAYEHRSTLQKGAEYFGVSRVGYKIFRKPAEITLNTDSAAIMWGDCLNDAGIIPSSGTVAGAFDIVVRSADEGYETVSAELASTVPAPGEYEFAYRFTPGGDDSANYSENYVTFTVTVDHGFEVGGDGGFYSETPAESAVSGGTFNYTFDVVSSGEGDAVSETLVFTLKAYLTGGAEWSFAGWRANNFYRQSVVSEESGFATYTYDYEIPLDGTEEEKEKQLSSSFRAVYIKTDNSSVASIEFSGNSALMLSVSNLARNNLFAGDDDLAGYSGISAEIKGYDYDGEVFSDTEPLGIGDHNILVELYTDATVEGSRMTLVETTIAFSIVRRNVSVVRSASASVGYNTLTGWARSVSYTVGNLPNNGVDEYYYVYTLITDGSTVAENEEVVWTKASSFVTPTVYGEYDISAKSAVITYRIIAVSETYGVPTEDTSLPVVAVSDPFTAKLDNTPLTINLFEAVETPEGWMQGLDFTAEVTFGGSGYDLTYGPGSGSSLTGNNVLLGADEVLVTDGWDQTGFTYGADPGTVTTSRTYSVSFRLDTDFFGVPSLGLRNGLSLGAVYAAVADSGVTVSIDASAPQISVETVYGGDPGDGGWYKDPVTVIITVTDQGGSLLEEDAELIASGDYQGITLEKDVGYEGIRYVATVTTSEYFEYTITDGAGNTGTATFNYSVQVLGEDVSLVISSSSVADEEIWVSDDLNMEFTVRISSGTLSVPVKLQYRNADYGEFIDAGSYVTPDANSDAVTLNFSVSLTESGDKRFYFRACAANGITTNLLDAGMVKIDNTAPVITLNEADYAGHTGEAPWTAEAVRVTVTVTDNLSGIPWDEENLIYGVYVEGRDDVVIEKISDTQFIVNVTDCNEYVISATDRAGNVVSAEGITLNVDPTMSPTFEVVAELTEDTTVTEYESGAWIIGNGTLNVTFTYDVVVSGTTIEYLNAGYWATLVSTTVPEDGSLLEEGHTFTFEIPAVEGKTNYRFRLRTGAGVTVTYPSDGYFTVSRDWTLPGAPSGNYYDSDNNAVDVTGTWSNQPVRWQFALTDSVSGIDAQTISLYDFDPVLMDTPEGEEELQKQLEEAVAAGIGTAPETLANGLYQYVLSENRIYIVRYADVAGNFNMYLFEALIDTTSGFTVNAVPYLKTGDQTASDPLLSGTELSDDQSVLFRFEVTDAEGGTFVAGASGLRAEYSFNGTDWLFVDEGFVVGVPELEFGSQAIGDIRIRLVTGAGIAVECSFDGESSFAYNKDTVEISLSLSASVTDEDGSESGYVSGEWTCNTVRVTVEIVAGAYGGTLSATGFDEVRIPENSGTAYHTYEISENTDSTFTFRFVSDKDGGSVESDMEIRIDKREVTLELTGEYDPDGQGGYRFEVGEEGWAFGEVVITAEVSAGFSGVAGVEYSYIDGEWHTAELTDGVYRIVWADADNATYNGRTYSVRAASVSGMTAESEIIILIDEANPQNGELTLTGFKGAGSDWYYTDVGISRRGLPINYSGTYFEYSAVLIDGGTERTDPVTGRCALDATDADFITLTDERFSAGYGEWKITYWWVTGAGRMTNGGEIVIGIDKNEYSFTAYSSVGGVTDELITEENRFAVMEDNGLLSGKLYRGMPLNNIKFSASAEGGGIQNGYAFLLRSVTVNGEVRVEYNYTDPAASMTYHLSDVYVEGDTVVEVGLYCAVVPEFVNLEQSVQANGRFVPITLNFPLILNGWFRYALQYTVTMPDEFDVGDPYGRYICTANMTGEFADNFPLVSYTDGEYVQSNTAAVTVRYFENAGTDEDMFRVRGIDDFKMIDRYTDPSDPGQIAFGYDGDHKFFLQEADIVLDSSFGGLKNVFDGVYNGGGYAFIADRVGGNTFRGVFSSVEGGRIEELKVEILRYEISSDGDYAVLTPYIGGAGSGVSNVYVSANVYIQNAAVAFGGVAAKADGALIAMSFAAVNVFADSVSGYVGGIVGSLTGGSYLTRCLSVSTITADGCSAPGGAGRAVLFAGSLAGYADGAGSTNEANFYMDGGVSYGKASLSERGLGNDDYPDAAELKFTAVEGQVGVSASETEILGMAPSELVNYYTGRLAERLEVSGTGSENNPFAISDAYALELVALVPWAYFRQTADIAPGSYAEYMNATPFRGSYDGDGFALTDIDLSDSGSSLGLFRSFEGTLTNLYIADMYADFLLPDGGYAGAFAGIIADNAAVSGVVITGNITVDAGGTVYAGGFAGISHGEADNIVSAIGMRLIASYAFIGGFAGNISGGKVEYVALAGGYEADYTGRADVGTVAGELNSDGADAIEMKAIGYIAGASAAAGYSVTIPFVGESDYVPVAESRSGLSGSKAYTSGKYAVTVGERLNGVYPFASGSGTDLDPFVINGYREFRNITSYMDASFVIGADFVLGDLNGDGIAEEKFEGFGGTFSGSISGNSRIISGLTAPLFEELSGSVRNLTFDAEIRSYSGSVIFGAVAERALPGALISRITVTGSAEIYADASSEIIFGGVLGISDGASVIGASMNMNVKLRGGTIFYGGIIGDSTAPQSEHSATWHIQSSVSADIGGVSVSAGKYIGIMRGDSTAVFASSASSLKINNVSDSRNVGKTLNS